MIKKRGMTIFHFVLGVIVILTVLVPCIYAMPSVTEYFAIKKAIKKASYASSAMEARNIFEKQAIIDSIASIKANDLMIYERDGKLDIAVDYQQPVPLYGNLSLLIHYQDRATTLAPISE